MFKKGNLTILFVLIFFFLKAQDYQIIFSGTGSSTNVDSVVVENITQNKRITVKGNEILHLTSISTDVIPIQENAARTLNIFPNPMVEASTIVFQAIASGVSQIEVFDCSGKVVLHKQDILEAGFHKFKISGLSKGVYSIRINSLTYSYSGKLVSVCTNKSHCEISEIGYEPLPSLRVPNLKNATSEKLLKYAEGDRLIMTGVSGKFSTIIIDIPTQNKTITFNFIPCSDGDGNNYSVVQIGNQLWMGENLRTTKLNDGTEIPNITKDSDWRALTTPGYCWANNDAANKSPYGGLYNWFAVNTGKLAPKGWHVATDIEWTDLIVFLGGDPLGFGGWVVCKLQETGSEHRESYSFNYYNATNETGFTAVPSGVRSGETSTPGWFSGFRSFGYWWTSTNADSESAFGRYVDININRFPVSKKNGMSVRCIKD